MCIQSLILMIVIYFNKKLSEKIYMFLWICWWTGNPYSSSNIWLSFWDHVLQCNQVLVTWVDGMFESPSCSLLPQQFNFLRNFGWKRSCINKSRWAFIILLTIFKRIPTKSFCFERLIPSWLQNSRIYKKSIEQWTGSETRKSTYKYVWKFFGF